MASVITREVFHSYKSLSSIRPAFSVVIRDSSFVCGKKPQRGTTKHRNLIKSNCEFLEARGFLRNQKSYNPAADVKERITKIFRKHFGPDFTMTDNISITDKFPVLKNCFEEFEHSVPNSMLHEIVTLQDIFTFYTTPVITVTPYDELKTKELPPNLNIIPDYIRFDPATDVKFDGVTAFPESPTVVTGLKARKKYKGHSDKLPLCYYNEAFYIK